MRKLPKGLDIFIWIWTNILGAKTRRCLLNKCIFKEKRLARIKADFVKHPHFVMTGNIGNTLWDLANPLLDLAVLLTVPVDIRMERVKRRAFENFGERALGSGDLYEQRKWFYGIAQSYETGENPRYCLAFHEFWLGELTYPTLRVDGTKPIDEIAEIIAGAAFSRPHIKEE